MRDLGRLLELIVRNSAPLPSVAEIFLFTLPATFTITLPMGVLVGILVGLSRLAADSEVTAIRASGMGVGMFVRVSVHLRHRRVAARDGEQHLRRARLGSRSRVILQDRLKTSQASFEIQPRVFYEDFKNIVLYVQDAIPDQRSGAVARHLPRRHQRSRLAQDHSGAARRAAERRPKQTALPPGRRHAAGIVPKVKDQYSITTFDNTEIPLILPSDESKPHDLLPVAELDLRSLLSNASPRARCRAEVLSVGHGQLQLRPDQGALLRDRIPSPLRACRPPAWCWRWSAFRWACRRAKAARAPASF